jgi:hypothetical protein
MKKPVDPRKHGLKEPQQVLTNIQYIYPPNMGGHFDKKTSLFDAVDLYNKELKEHLKHGRRVVNGPFISNIGITYTVEWDNQLYALELDAYNAAIIKYEQEVAAYIKHEDDKKNRRLLPPNLDDKIKRVKERLANLEATRDGKPLPYPELGE